MGPGSIVEAPFVTSMPDGAVDPKKWWRSTNLCTLNLLLAFPMLSIFTQGYECTASLPRWHHMLTKDN